MTMKELDVTAGGGGRTPVVHVMTVDVYDVTVHGTPLMTTLTSASAVEPKPVPVSVTTVPPRELPLLGDTEVTTGVLAVRYANGDADVTW